MIHMLESKEFSSILGEGDKEKLITIPSTLFLR